jgi:hypothetical protein
MTVVAGEGSAPAQPTKRPAKVNEQHIILGYPGSGKTEFARVLVLEQVRRGRVVIIQDPYREFVDLPGARWFAGARDCEDAIRRAAFFGADMDPILCVGGEDADPITELAMRTARECKDGPIIVLVLNESALMTESSASYIGRRDKILVTSRRHLGLVPILVAQDSGVLTALWLRMTTCFHLFALHDAARIGKIESLANVRDLRDTLPRLGMPCGAEGACAHREHHQFISVRPGQSALDVPRRAV